MQKIMFSIELTAQTLQVSDFRDLLERSLIITVFGGIKNVPFKMSEPNTRKYTWES